MNQTVGQILQEARTRRGLDLNEAERVTKIRVKFLRAMEEDRWEELPAPVYARSFLATYARFLGLDEGPLLAECESLAEGADRPEPIRPGTIRRGGIGPRRRPRKPALLLVAGLAAVVLLGLAIVGSLGSSGGGEGKSANHRAGQRAQTSTATATSPSSSQVSVELRATADVWVCLVGADGRNLVAETLPSGEARGPFEGPSFDVTFGNGAVDMTVDGEPAKVPPLAEPLGYRITTGGVHRLDSASEPTCT